jgi:3-oxoacyl-[acyl-carrier-protein] synthase II
MAWQQDDGMAMKRVVVTGYGAICSLGENVEQIWEAIMNYRVGYRRIEFPDTNIKAKFFGFMEPSRKRYDGFSKNILKMSPDFAKYALVASREALSMAFGSDIRPTEHLSAFDIGAIIGTGWGGTDSVNYNNADYRQYGMSTSFAALMSMHSVGTGIVSLNWNLRGYQNTPVAACATGTMAIGDAYEVIRSGRQIMMLAGGSESLKEQCNVWSIDVMQALSKEQDDATLACCPFDLNRSGFVLSEGAAVLCLEEMQHAIERGATILGEVTGYANYSDAFDMTAPAEDMGARVRVIQKALSNAGKKPEDIDYINVHGTSTPLNDINESNALKVALGDAAYGISMSSTKSYSGHLIGAAGSLESIICLKAISSGTIPATSHIRNPDPACDLNYTPNVHATGRQVNTAMNLSFGFGGTNCGVVLERFSEMPQ